MSLPYSTKRLKKWIFIFLSGFISICLIAGTYLYHKSGMDEVYNKNGDLTILISLLLIVILLLLGSVFVLIYKYRQSNIYKEKYLKEKAFKETLQEFKTTLYSIGDGVITTDPSGQIVRMNLVAENLTGWTEDEAKGIPLNKVFNIIDKNSGNKIDIHSKNNR